MTALLITLLAAVGAAAPEEPTPVEGSPETLLPEQAVPVTSVPKQEPSELINDPSHVNVVLGLRGNAELATGHAGYWSALQARPEWLELEAVYWELLRTSDLGPLLVQADEWLLANDEKQALFDSAYETLAKSDDLRRAFEQFERGLLTMRGDIRQWLGAGDYLQGNPAEALKYLSGITDQITLPEPLKPYALELYDEKNWSSLREPLQQMLNSATEAAPVLEWWKSVSESAGDGEPLTRLSLHFLQRPNRFWAWHRRELALAQDPALRDWVRWWHRELRRRPIPYEGYLRYLGAVRLGQETPPAAPKVAWPPLGPTPELKPLSKSRIPEPKIPGAQAPGIARPEVSQPTAPERPGVTGPTRPERPTARQSELLKDRAE